MATKEEVRTMARENFEDVRTMLDALPDERWDEATFCEGWRVRDLVGHLLAGTTIPIPKFVATVAAGGFRIDDVSKRVSIEHGNQPISVLREKFNEETSREKYRGFAGLLTPNGILLDWVTHYLDIVTPLDIDVDIPDARMAAALEPTTGSRQRNVQRAFASPQPTSTGAKGQVQRSTHPPEYSSPPWAVAHNFSPNSTATEPRSFVSGWQPDVRCRTEATASGDRMTGFE